jgi:hypothetical protein
VVGTASEGSPLYWLVKFTHTHSHTRGSGTCVEKLWQLCGVGGRVKTMTSWSQHIVLMLPQQTVQPKNKEACTVAPLHPPEPGAKSSNPCVYGDEFYAVFSSIVAKAGHAP